jgi:hypothetical protein
MQANVDRVILFVTRGCACFLLQIKKSQKKKYIGCRFLLLFPVGLARLIERSSLRSIAGGKSQCENEGFSLQITVKVFGD